MLVRRSAPILTLAPVLAAALALAGCAATQTETETAEAPSARVRVVTPPAPAAAAPTAAPVAAERAAPVRLVRPDAAYARLPRYGRRAVTGEDDLIVFDVPAEGLDWRAVLERVAAEARVTIFYDEGNAVVRARRVSLRGRLSIPRSDLVAWCADVAAMHGLTLNPLGPPDRRQYTLLDTASASSAQAPQFVPEDELPEFVGRGGLYISSVLTTPAGVDPARVRQVLSQFSTKTAGLGRINDVPDSRSLVVADFAHVVATMRRALDEMEIHAWEEQQRAGE